VQKNHRNVALSWSKKLIYRLFPGLKNNLIKLFGIDKCESVTTYDLCFPRHAALMNDKFLLNLAAGYIEREEILLCLAHLPIGCKIVEFGGGLGIAATIINKHKAPCQHICFEVNPQARAYCQHVASLNHIALDLRSQALGSGEATTFYLCDDYVKSGFTKPEGATPYQEIHVETASMGDVIADHKPDVVICDIEGAEDDFIDPHKMAGISSVMIELHPHIYGQDKTNEIKQRFISAGFAERQMMGDVVFYAR